MRYPVEVCAAMADRLAGVVDGDGNPTRRLTPQEDTFIANERLLTKVDFRYWGERYAHIRGVDGLQRLYPLWEPQTIILEKLAAIQLQRVQSQHPDGLLVTILKARQEGVTTLAQALLAHRVTTQTHVNALTASDVPENSGSEGIFGKFELLVDHLPWYLRPATRFHAKNTHWVFANGSWMTVESGKSMKGGLAEVGGTKGNLGRSRTYTACHLSELSTWERPEQIDDGLMPAIPRSLRTLVVKESTAKGRHNWHHEDWILAVEGHGRFLPIFLPWYALAQYALPPPLDWTPDPLTLAHAQKATQEGPRWLGRPVDLSRAQLYWYEETRREYVAKNSLAKFLEEYAADPEEAFQHSGRSIFSVEQLQYLDRLAKPMIDCWSVDPAKDLSVLRQEELEAIARRRAADALQAQAEAARARDREPLGVSLDGR